MVFSQPRFLIEPHVQRGRRKPLLAADHVRYFHQVVIHHVGQVIGGQLVGRLVDHLVIKHRGVDDHLAADHIVNHYLFFGFNFHPYHVLGLQVDQSLGLLFS